MTVMLGTKDEVLIVIASDSQCLCWCVGELFRALPGMMSYAGGAFSIGFGYASLSSTTQEVS